MEKKSSTYKFLHYIWKNAVIDLIVTKEVPSNTDVYKLLNNSGKVVATCLGGEKLCIVCIQ
jgi:hypothetical protein